MDIDTAVVLEVIRGDEEVEATQEQDGNNQKERIVLTPRVIITEPAASLIPETELQLTQQNCEVHAGEQLTMNQSQEQQPLLTASNNNATEPTGGSAHEPRQLIQDTAEIIDEEHDVLVESSDPSIRPSVHIVNRCLGSLSGQDAPILLTHMSSETEGPKSDSDYENNNHFCLPLPEKRQKKHLSSNVSRFITH